MTKDRVIDAVAWHTQAENVETREHVIARFGALARFLDENGLTVSRLAAKPIDDAFEIRTSDLNDEGYAVVMDAAYESWVRGIDRGKPPDDVTRLKKALEKIRKK